MATLKQQIDIDAGEAINTIEELKKKITAYQDAILAAQTANEDYSETVAKLARAQAGLNEITELTKNSTKALADVSEKLSDAVGVVEHGFKAAKAATTLFVGESELLNTVFKKIEASMTLVKSLAGLSSALKTTNLSFKALNATIKANPFVALVGILVTLVGIFTAAKKELSFITDAANELWEGITDLIPGLSDLSGFFEEFMAILNGVGKVITTSLIAPFKAFLKILKFDFKGAMEEAEKASQIVTNFAEGYNKQMNKYDQERADASEKLRQERLLGLGQEIKDTIDANESKYGADWKYTEDAKALYEDYFTNLLLAYGEDSAEYKRALNDKERYNREFQERIDEAERVAAEKRRAAAEAYRQKEVAAKEQYDQTLLELDKEERRRQIDKAEEYEKLGLIAMELTDTQEKLVQAEEKLKNSSNWQEKAAAQQVYKELLNESLALEKEYDTLNDKIKKDNDDKIKAEEEIKTQRKETEDAYTLALEARNATEAETLRLDGLKKASDKEKAESDKKKYEEDLVLAEKELNDHQTKLSNIKAELDLENLTAERKAELQTEYIKGLGELETAEKKVATTKKKISDEDKKIKADDKKRLEAALEQTKNFLDASTKLVGENTVAAKAMAVSGAVINTYLGATKALASYPPPASYIAMAATIATGLATVVNIFKTKVPGASDSSSATAASIPLPEMPSMDADFVETHNNLDGKQEEKLNTQSVLVVEDVNAVQNRVKVAETKATF